MSVEDRIAPAVVVRLIAALVVAQLVALLLSRPGPERMTITADFNRAGLNIRAGDEVRVRGLPVGTVKEIKTDRKDFSATYVLSVDPATPIAKNSGARIVPKTLFGDKYVELDPAESGYNELASGAHIPQRRTKTVTEFQQVLDRFTPALQAVDPDQLGGTISAMAAGLGNGLDLGRMTTGVGVTFDEIAGRQADIARLLQHVPGTAEAFGNGAADMRTIAVNMGRLADAMAKNEPTLAKFLSENAELLATAGELMTTERDRIQRLTAGGFDVLSIVAANPGSIAGFMKGQAGATIGLRSVEHYGVMFAGVAHMMVGWPTPLQNGGVNDEQTALGPEVVIDHPWPPASDQSVDLSPITNLLPPPLGPAGAAPGGAAPPAPGGVGGLLDRVVGR